jgi:primosomal protein N' (replication factor Y)
LRQYGLEKACDKCQTDLIMLGFGTQRLATYLEEIFPAVPVLILDTDHLKNSVQVKQCFDSLKTLSPAILIGTQMISKGHDWPLLSLVIVLVGTHQIKEELRLSVVQQINQTAGRAGRHRPGRVLMPLPHQELSDSKLQRLLSCDYFDFMTYWAQEHHIAQKYQAKFLFQSASIEKLMQPLKQFCKNNLLWGPCLDYPYRRGSLWRFYVMFSGQDRKSRAIKVTKALNEINQHPVLRKNFLSVEIDPLDF